MIVRAIVVPPRWPRPSRPTARMAVVRRRLSAAKMTVACRLRMIVRPTAVPVSPPFLRPAAVWASLCRAATLPVWRSWRWANARRAATPAARTAIPDSRVQSMCARRASSMPDVWRLWGASAGCCYRSDASPAVIAKNDDDDDCRGRREGRGLCRQRPRAVPMPAVSRKRRLRLWRRLSLPLTSRAPLLPRPSTSSSASPA